MYYETNKTATEYADLFLMEALVAVGVLSVEKVEEMKTEYEVAEVVLNITEETPVFEEEAVGPPFSMLFEVSLCYQVFCEFLV